MSDTEQKQGPEDIIGELNKLGENLAKALRTMWDSEERKSIERELRAGVEQMSRHVNQAVETAKVDEKLKQAGTQVKQAMDSAHVPEMMADLRKGLAEGLKRLNVEVEKFANPKPADEVSPDGHASEAAQTVVEGTAKVVDQANVPPEAQ